MNFIKNGLFWVIAFILLLIIIMAVITFLDNSVTTPDGVIEIIEKQDRERAKKNIDSINTEITEYKKEHKKAIERRKDHEAKKKSDKDIRREISDILLQHEFILKESESN